MISKKNSALIFDPNFLFYKKIHKQTRILLFHLKKHEIFGGVAYVSHGTKTYFHMTTCGFFFRTLRRSKGCDFSSKKYLQNSA